MIHDEKNDNYLIKSAWKLYIEKRILKRRVLRDEVAYGWERARLAGVEYNQLINNLSEVNDVQSNIWFTPIMKELIAKENLSVIISTADAIIVDSVIRHKQLMDFLPNKKIRQSKTGNMSLYSTINNTATTYCCGAEHYLECLHFTTDYSMVIHIKHSNYILTFFEEFNSIHPVKRLKKLEKIKNKWLETWNSNVVLADKKINNTLNTSQPTLNMDEKFTLNGGQKLNNNQCFKNQHILVLGNKQCDINNKIKSIYRNLENEFAIFTIDFWYTDLKIATKAIQWQEGLDNALIIFKNTDKLSIDSKKKFIKILLNMKKNSGIKMVTITIVDNTKNALDNNDINVFDDIIELTVQKCDENIELCGDVGALYNLSEIEKTVIKKALKKTNQNMSKAAKLLNICRSTLYRKIEKYDID